MEDVKKSHNKQTLTELWKKGELEQGWYYVKNEFGSIFVSEYSKGYDHINERIEKDFFTEVSDITEVLAPVPSFNEWQQMKAFCEEFNALEVAEENQRLKELLKECNLLLIKQQANDEVEHKESAELVLKIEEVLK